MTCQSRRILKTLKKCQPREGGWILVACEDDAPCSFTNDDTGRRVPSPFDSDKTLTIFAFLQSRGLIEYDEPYGVKVTHAGYHSFQISAKSAWHEFVRSFVMPFLVALATALLFSWLAARFNWFTA